MLNSSTNALFDSSNIRLILIIAKQWFDETAEKQYFSTQVRLIDKEFASKTILVPFHMGSGCQYVTKSMAVLRAEGYIDPMVSEADGTTCEGKFVKIIGHIHDRCTKAEMIAWGNDY